jgi:hypothetical protein
MVEHVMSDSNRTGGSGSGSDGDGGASDDRWSSESAGDRDKPAELEAGSVVVTSAEPVEDIPGGDQRVSSDIAAEEVVARPGKVMRIGSMVKRLLEEVRQAPLDEAGRARLAEIYDISVRELASGLSEDLARELDTVIIPFDEDSTPSEAELRVAQAQLVGWLEGLFHGIQATLFAQQVAARSQLEEMQRRVLPAPGGGPERAGGTAASPGGMSERPGTYL